jgi:hypothetical protein
MPDYEIAFDVRLNAIARVRVHAAGVATAEATARRALAAIDELDLSSVNIPDALQAAGAEATVRLTEASLATDPKDARRFEPQ